MLQCSQAPIGNRIDTLCHSFVLAQVYQAKVRKAPQVARGAGSAFANLYIVGSPVHAFEHVSPSRRVNVVLVGQWHREFLAMRRISLR